jgi:ribosomal protein S26
MVKVVYCDRCGKELKRKEKWEESAFDFDDFFEDKNFGDISEATINGEKVKIPKKILKVQLCQDCIIGYNKIVDNANKEVKNYLKNNKEKDIKKESKDKKKFGLFKS